MVPAKSEHLFLARGFPAAHRCGRCPTSAGRISDCSKTQTLRLHAKAKRTLRRIFEETQMPYLHLSSVVLTLNTGPSGDPCPLDRAIKDEQNSSRSWLASSLVLSQLPRRLLLLCRHKRRLGRSVTQHCPPAGLDSGPLGLG